MENNTVRFIGDVHGKYKRYKRLIRQVPFSIAVGDIGVGFRKQNGQYFNNPPFDTAERAGRHLYIRGNHDNPDDIIYQKHYIPDGTYLDPGIFCIGGAGSVDWAWRTPGYSWWPNEELTTDELEIIKEKYASIKPNVVVTHDCPSSLANEILLSSRKEKENYGERTRSYLEQMLYIHKPKLWVFGHWHQSLYIMKHYGTTFICLDELEYIDINLEDYL